MDDSATDGDYYQTSKVCQETERETDESEEEAYCFSNPRRGHAVIIIYSKDCTCNDRPGWEVDKYHLEETFSTLGFNVHTCVNYTSERLLEYLQKVADDDHSDYDCLILAVSSHGGETVSQGLREDVIQTTNKPLKTREILDMFTDKRCPSLSGKPRICFIQACRGENFDNGQEIVTDGMSNNDDMTDSILVDSDDTDVIPMGMLQYYVRRVNYPHEPWHMRDTLLDIDIRKMRTQPRPITTIQTPKHVFQDSKVPSLVVPCHNDFLVMYATPPGYYAFRRQKDGSWFIKTMAEVLSKSDGTKSLTKQLTQITRLIAENFSSVSKQKTTYHNKKQMPVIYSMLCKDVFLAPKNK